MTPGNLAAQDNRCPFVSLFLKEKKMFVFFLNMHIKSKMYTYVKKK